MNLVIRPLQAADVPAADRIFGEAFAKFLGIADPRDFIRDRALIATRWRADPEAPRGAFVDGALVGSCFITRWGSLGFIGPVSVRPDFWDKGVAKRLVAAAVEFLDQSGIRQGALFTFAGSPRHIALYQKFGFWPQHLTLVMTRDVVATACTAAWSRFSALPPAARTGCFEQCRGITDRIFPGLDLATEIRSIADQRLGETILVHDDGGLAGFACFHVGAGSEAGAGVAFVKFAAVRPGDGAPATFGRLLDACEAFAAEARCNTLVAGVNAARHQAYRQMIDRGFRILVSGVAMLRPDAPGFNRTDCFVIDDLR
jgi:GNAT superfamily N-acetyltransferase